MQLYDALYTIMSLHKIYKEEIPKKLMKELNVDNPMAIPRLEKVVINVGLGEAVANKGAIEHVQKQLSVISGQKPVVTRARKSVSAFKIRKGLPIGVKVTLRGKRMLDFLDKVIAIVFPRVRDFRGIKESSVDAKGNLNIGFTDQTLFPEIEFDAIDKLRGLQVTVVTTTTDREQGKKLFELMGFPFHSA